MAGQQPERFVFSNGPFEAPDVIGPGSETTAVYLPQHPLSIKPSGNAYAAGTDLKCAAGYLCCLPDELIIQILEYLDATSLLKVATCKALYAFSRFEDLWKSLVVEYVCSIASRRSNCCSRRFHSHDYFWAATKTVSVPIHSSCCDAFDRISSLHLRKSDGLGRLYVRMHKSG